MMTAPSDKWKFMWCLPTTQPTLTFHPEFAYSGHLLLTDNYNVNKWWLALCNWMSFQSLWWMLLDEQARLMTVILFKTMEIWFAKQPRRPPDKAETCSQSNLTISSYLYEWIMHHFSIFLFVIEDAIYFAFGYNIDLSISLYIFCNVFLDYLKQFISIFIAIQFHSSSQVVEGEDWINLIASTKVPQMAVNKNDPSYFKYKKHVISKVVISMSTKSKRNELDQNVALDTDSYMFAVDTCTSENICKHEELFKF